MRTIPVSRDTARCDPCPRCHRPDCATAAALYAQIVVGARANDVAFYEGVFEMTAINLFRRGWSGRRTDVEQRFVAAHADTLSPARQRQRLQRAEALARTRSASVGMPHHAALTTPAVPPVTSLPDGGSTAVTTVLVGAR